MLLIFSLLIPPISFIFNLNPHYFFFRLWHPYFGLLRSITPIFISCNFIVQLSSSTDGYSIVLNNFFVDSSLSRKFLRFLVLLYYTPKTLWFFENTVQTRIFIARSYMTFYYIFSVVLFSKNFKIFFQLYRLYVC